MIQYIEEYFRGPASDRGALKLVKHENCRFTLPDPVSTRKYPFSGVSLYTTEGALYV